MTGMAGMAGMTGMTGMTGMAGMTGMTGMNREARDDRDDQDDGMTGNGMQIIDQAYMSMYVSIHPHTYICTCPPTSSTPTVCQRRDLYRKFEVEDEGLVKKSRRP